MQIAPAVIVPSGTVPRTWPRLERGFSVMAIKRRDEPIEPMDLTNMRRPAEAGQYRLALVGVGVPLVTDSPALAPGLGLASGARSFIAADTEPNAPKKRAREDRSLGWHSNECRIGKLSRAAGGVYRACASCRACASRRLRGRTAARRALRPRCVRRYQTLERDRPHHSQSCGVPARIGRN